MQLMFYFSDNNKYFATNSFWAIIEVQYWKYLEELHSLEHRVHSCLVVDQIYQGELK